MNFVCSILVLCSPQATTFLLANELGAENNSNSLNFEVVDFGNTAPLIYRVWDDNLIYFLYELFELSLSSPQVPG